MMIAVFTRPWFGAGPDNVPTGASDASRKRRKPRPRHCEIKTIPGARRGFAQALQGLAGGRPIALPPPFAGDFLARA